MPTLYSQLVTNEVASPRVANNPIVAKGALHEAIALVTPAADQADDTIMLLARVPTNCRIRKIAVTAADASSAGKIDIGLYRVPELGGAVMDRDFFASAFDLTGGPFAESDQKNESASYTLAKQCQPLWQAAAVDSADPGGEYMIAATVETLFNGGPTSILFHIEFAV